MNQELITNNRTLKMLNDAGLIVWPCMINNSKGIKFKYVDTVNDNYSFTHKGISYILKFHDGCFMPYVYKIHTNHILVKYGNLVIRQRP
jgi:hypothetical protein